MLTSLNTLKKLLQQSNLEDSTNINGMLFKQIIGQKEVIERLKQSVQEERISHGQLFFGPEGCGKLALAIAYIQLIFCENRQNGNACGTCPSCLKIAKFSHPDLHFVFPSFVNAATKKRGSADYMGEFRALLAETNCYPNMGSWLKHCHADSKSMTMYKEDVERIIHIVNYKSYESEYKAIVIWMAEKLDVKLAPKILKVLEEPPPKTLFILISEHPEQMLPTIQSRVQMIKIPALDSESLAKHLEEQKQISPQEAFRVAQLSGGNLPEALELIERVDESSDFFLLFRDWMRSCYTGDVPNMSDNAERFTKLSRENQKSFLRYALLSIQWSNWMNYGLGANVRLQGDESAFFDKFCKWITPANIAQFSTAFEEAVQHITRNANPTILFIDLSMKIAMWLKMGR